MKKIILLILFSAFFVGCGLYNHSTKYPNKEVTIGESKEDILKKYGKPFGESISIEDGNIIETIYYKERVFVSAYDYILSTYFYFQNSKLIKKEQKEEEPPSNLKVRELEK